MSDDYKDEPLQLVALKDDGMLEITVEGINYLSSMKNDKVYHCILHIQILGVHIIYYWAQTLWQVVSCKFVCRQDGRLQAT